MARKNGYLSGDMYEAEVVIIEPDDGSDKDMLERTMWLTECHPSLAYLKLWCGKHLKNTPNAHCATITHYNVFDSDVREEVWYREK